MGYIKEKEEDIVLEKWRGGVFLCSTKNSFEADILESKLRGEGIPCVKKYRGASNFLEITMGFNSMFPIDIYVPEETLQDARNIIIAVPLEDCDPIDYDA